MRFVLVFVGAAIAFCLLVYVSPMTMLGVTCFAIAAGNGGCMSPAVYYGAWFLAVGAVGFGLFPRSRNMAAGNDHAASDAINLHHPKWRALVDLDHEIGQARC